MDYRALLLVFGALTFLTSIQAKRPFSIEISNFTCRILEPSIGHELTCILHRKRIVPSLSVRFKITETVKAFNLLYDLSLIKKDNSKMNIGHHKLDGCKFLNSFYGSNIVGKFFKRIQRVSNIPTKCPIPGNEFFEIRNYTILDSEYPPVVPAVTYLILLQIETDNKIIADIYVEGSVSY